MRLTLLLCIVSGCAGIQAPRGEEPPHQSAAAVVAVCDAIARADYARFASLQDIAKTPAAWEQPIKAVETVAAEAKAEAAKAAESDAEVAKSLETVKADAMDFAKRLTQAEIDTQSRQDQIDAIWNKLAGLEDILKELRQHLNEDAERIDATDAVVTRLSEAQKAEAGQVVEARPLAPVENKDRTILITGDCVHCRRVDRDTLPTIRKSYKVAEDDISADLEIVNDATARGAMYRMRFKLKELMPAFVRLKNGVVVSSHYGYLSASELRDFMSKP